MAEDVADATQRRGGAEATSAVTPERLRQVVTTRGYHVRTAPDASIAGRWDGYQFQLRLAGEQQDVLSVRGTWGRWVPDGLEGPVVQAINDWNRDKVWPTVFTAPLEDGLTVRTEIMADVSAGATDRQLLDLIEGGLSSGVQFFQALGRSMPPVQEPSPES
ncbi:MAG: type III secretion system chaperone family protein [Georgenia sp.]